MFYPHCAISCQLNWLPQILHQNTAAVNFRAVQLNKKDFIVLVPGWCEVLSEAQRRSVLCDPERGEGIEWARRATFPAQRCNQLSRSDYPLGSYLLKRDTIANECNACHLEIENILKSKISWNLPISHHEHNFLSKWNHPKWQIRCQFFKQSHIHHYIASALCSVNIANCAFHKFYLITM